MGVQMITRTRGHGETRSKQSSELLILFEFRLVLDCWTQAGIQGVLAECGCGARLDTSVQERSARGQNSISLGDAGSESPPRQHTNYLTEDVGLSRGNWVQSNWVKTAYDRARKDRLAKILWVDYSCYSRNFQMRADVALAVGEGNREGAEQ